MNTEMNEVDDTKDNMEENTTAHNPFLDDDDDDVILSDTIEENTAPEPEPEEEEEAVIEDTPEEEEEVKDTEPAPTEPEAEDIPEDSPTIEEADEDAKEVAEEENDEDEDDEDSFDLLNVFNNRTTSSELSAGVHERVKLINIDCNKRKDNNGNEIKKILFLKFKKFNKEGADIGEKEISFFPVDYTKESAVNNLFTFISQLREFLSLHFSEEELTESFNPIGVLYDGDNDDREESVVAIDYHFDNIKKKVLKKERNFIDVEKAACTQFKDLLENKVGFDSPIFRLKLEESTDGKYIQIPRFDRFVEKAGTSKEDSVLYTNEK